MLCRLTVACPRYPRPRLISFSALRSPVVLQVVQAGAAAAAAAPLLRPAQANAEGTTFVQHGRIYSEANGGGKAPIITIFDHRGCTRHANAEYKVRMRPEWHRGLPPVLACVGHGFRCLLLPLRRAGSLPVRMMRCSSRLS